MQTFWDSQNVAKSLRNHRFHKHVLEWVYPQECSDVCDMVLLVFWLLQYCEELWLTIFFDLHYLSQEHGTIFLFWKQGLLGHFRPQKKKLYQNFKIYNVKGFATLGHLAVYLDLLPFLDFFLESFFLVFSGGGGGCSSSSLSSSSPLPLLLLPILFIFGPCRTFISTNKWLGPLLVVTLGAGSTLGAVLPALSSSLSSSSLLPSELSLSPSDACILTCKA